MKSAGWWVSLAWVGAAVPAVAQAPDPPPLAAELPAIKLLDQINGRTPAARRLELLDQALALLPQPTPTRGAVLCARAQTLGELARPEEARAAFAQCRQLRPNDPRVLIGSAFEELQHGQPAQAAQILMRAAAIAPDLVRQVPSANMGALFRQLRYARADRLLDDVAVALATAGWGRDNPVEFSGLAVTAMRHRLADGETADALAMLPSVLSPAAGVSMMIDRRYQPIWPQVEAWAGRDLSVQRRALVEGAQAAYRTTRSPDDLLAYASALFQTGHRDRAVSEVQVWLAASGAGAGAFYRHAAIVRLGSFLGETGMRDQGIARMKAALTGPDAKDESVANIVPNLVIQMLLAQDHKGALAILDAHTPTAQGVENEAALGYFVALRACALSGDGRKAEAEKDVARVRTAYAANEAAVTMAVNCVADADAQAANWIKRVEGEETRTGALFELASARYRAAKGLPVGSLDEAALRRIAGRPDVDAAYDRLGRTLPERYAPALGGFEGVPDG